MRSMIAGGLASLAGCYLAAAFVVADINWMSGLWQWDATGRCALLYAAINIGGLGAMIGSAARAFRRDQKGEGE